MRIGVKIPKLGLTIDEVTLSSWEQEPGSAVTEGDVIAVLEADKASYDLTAPASGILAETLFVAGDMIPVGETVAIINT